MLCSRVVGVVMRVGWLGGLLEMEGTGREGREGEGVGDAMGAVRCVI